MPILLLSRVVWRIFFLSTVSITLLLSLLVLASLYVQSLAPQLENWASQHLQQPVRVGTLQVLWFQGMPRLQLRDIRLPTPATDQSDVYIKQMQITLDWWQSLQSGTWQMQSIAVQTQQLTLWRQADNHIVLVGVHQTTPAEPPQQPPPVATTSGQWLTWLRQQPQVHFSIAQLTWLEPNGERWQFAQLSLDLTRQSDQQHAVQLQAALPYSLPYLQGGLFHFDGLTRWQQNQLLAVRGDLQLWQAHFTTPDQEQHPLTLSTQLVAQPLAAIKNNPIHPTLAQQAWRVQLNQLQLKLATQTWLPTQLSVDFIPLATKGYRFQAHLEYLALNQLLPWLQQWGRKAVWYDYVSQLQGSVRNITAMYQTDNDWSMRGELHNLQHRPQGWWPGLENFNAEVQLQPDGGQLTLTQADLRWHPPNFDQQALILYQLSGALTWQRTAQQWRISSQGIQTHLFERLIQAQGWLQFGPQGTDSDFKVQLARLPLSEIHRYVPDIKLNKAVHWLKNALVGGTLNALTAHFHGPLNNWFRNGPQAGFHAEAEVIAGQLKFHPEWPQVNAIQAKLSILGQRLTISAQQARLYSDTEAHQVTASIAELGVKQPLLTAQIAAHSTIEEGLRFLRESPVRKTLNPDQDLPQLSGEAEVNLQLKIPLSPADKVVQGSLLMHGLRLHQQDLNIVLEDLAGPVQFTTTELSGQLEGTWHEQPIQLTLAAALGAHSNDTPVQAQLSGNADIAFIRQQLQQFAPTLLTGPWLTKLSGQTAWHVQLTLPTRQQKAQGQAVTHLVLNTDLQGLKVALPSPLGKPAALVRPLTLTLTLPTAATQPPQLQVNYDTLFSLAVRLTHPLLQGRLHFGRAPVTMPDAPGWVITGQLSQPLQPLAWGSLFNETLTTSREKDETTATASPPLTVDLKLAQLTLPWLPLQTVQLQLQQTQGLWTTQIDSDRLSGRLSYQQSHGLQIRLQRLHLTQPTASATASPTALFSSESLTPETWPALLLIAEQVQLDEYTLGELRMMTEPTTQGIALKQFVLSAPHLALTAHGEWQTTAQGEHSTLVLQGVSENVGQLLRNYGFTTVPIQDGRLEWLLDVVWPEGFFAFSLARVVGSLSILLTKGHLVDIEPGAVGRVIGLLDLQALPRRLAMDFRDVFETGLGFDIIAGDFALSDGYAETDNLILQASAARVEINGRTSFVDRTYDQTVTVTPHVSNTLPLAGIIAGGLSAGAVTLIVHQLLQAQIEKAMQYHYRVTGPWETPNIEALNKSASEAENNISPKSWTRD